MNGNKDNNGNDNSIKHEAIDRAMKKIMRNTSKKAHARTPFWVYVKGSDLFL